MQGRGKFRGHGGFGGRGFGSQNSRIEGNRLWSYLCKDHGREGVRKCTFCEGRNPIVESCFDLDWKP